jgi:glycosyltransferase involved in cell wall biosynthesis
MYPSKQKAYAGIFVKNQYEQLQEIISPADELEIFYMKRAFTGPVGSVLKYVGAAFRFIPYLFKKHDIIHLHYFYPLILLAWLKKKIHPNTKIVVTFLGRDINSQVNEKNQAFYTKISKEVDFSIPVGKTMAEQVRKKLDLQEMEILPCGVKKSVFFHEPGTEKKYDFIFVGSFIHRKGIDTVIEMIKMLKPEEGIRFCFCGSGQYQEQLSELAKTYNITIKSNQTQDQLRGLMNQSRYFLLMSRAEGFATATTEAFFCGLPVVTSDIDNFKEQVTVGENGYTVPLENAEALYERIQHVVNLPAEEYDRMSRNALNSFRSASLEEVCSSIYSIYQDLYTPNKAGQYH